MNLLVDIVSWILISAGGFFCVAGGIGLIRMPDFYTRLHAASIIETAGAGMLLAGMALQSGLTLVSAKLAIIALLIFFASPVATHALANAALARGLQPQVDEGGVTSKP